MGYEKADLITHVPFEFHHHDDVEATLECSRGRMFLFFLFNINNNFYLLSISDAKRGGA